MRSVATLFSPPSSTQAHDGEYGDDISLPPAILGLGATVPPNDLVSTQPFNLNTSTASISHAWNEQYSPIVDETSISHFYIPEAPQLNEEERARFGRFGRSLRLPKEEGGLKVYYYGQGAEYTLGQGRDWRAGWEPSLMVVNKLILGSWRTQTLPRWE